MITCAHCGRPVPAVAFCIACGQRLTPAVGAAGDPNGVAEAEGSVWDAEATISAAPVGATDESAPAAIWPHRPVWPDPPAGTGTAWLAVPATADAYSWPTPPATPASAWPVPAADSEPSSAADRPTTAGSAPPIRWEPAGPNAVNATPNAPINHRTPTSRSATSVCPRCGEGIRLDGGACPRCGFAGPAAAGWSGQHRKLPVDLILVALVYGVAGVWFLWLVRSIFGALPAMIGGIFSDEPLAYSLAYLFFLISVLVIYVGVALVAVSIALFRRDPLGRGLATVVFAAILATAIMSQVGAMVPIAVISGGSCLVLWISPGCRTALADDRRHRPPGVVLAGTITVAYFSLASVVTFGGLIAVLRFGSELGSDVLTILATALACVLAWMGHAKAKRAQPAGRVLLTIAMLLVALLMIIEGSGSNVLIALVLAGSVAVPLWAPARSQAWFRQDGAPPAVGQQSLPSFRWQSRDE